MWSNGLMLQGGETRDTKVMNQGMIPGQQIKIPQAMQHGQKNKNSYKEAKCLLQAYI